jgi:hypothetical protein
VVRFPVGTLPTQALQIPVVSQPFRVASRGPARSTVPVTTATGGRLLSTMPRMSGAGPWSSITPRCTGTATVRPTALVLGASRTIDTLSI